MNLRRLLYKIQSIPYEIKCLFFPYNKLKLQGLDRHYHDRDEVMFHAIFQCLVDYVELEHPFVSWAKNEKGRYTNIQEMSEHIEKSFGPNSNMALDSECNDEFYDEAIKRQYAYYKEQLALYIWYKQDYPNRIDPYDIIGDIEFDDIFDASIKKYPNSLITFEEATEIEEEYEAEEDKMLVRLLKIRRSLWT